MIFKIIKKLFPSFLLVLIIVLTSCKTQTTTPTQPQASPPVDTAATVKTDQQQASQQAETQAYLKQFAGNKEPLAVDYVSPEGAADVLANKIVVHFSQPMVALSAIGEEAPVNQMISISPQPKGYFKWVNTKTLVYQTSGELPYATHFTVTVKANLKSLLGNVLEKEVAFNFWTPAPAILSVFPMDTNDRPIGLKQYFDIQFNQPMDPDKLKADISLLQAETTKIPYELKCSKESPEDDQVPKTCKKMTLVPTKEMTKDTEVRLSLAKGVRGLGGPDRSEQEFLYTYRTHKDFEISGVSCGGECRPPYAKLKVDLTTLPEQEELKKFMTFEPATVPLDEIYGYQDYSTKAYQISFWPKAKTHYTVTFKKGLKDEFGQELKKDVAFSFDTDHAQASLAAPRLEDQVLIYNEKMDLGFEATNALNITASFLKDVSDENILKYLSSPWEKTRGLFIEKWDKQMSFTGEVTDEPQHFSIPLKDVLGGQKAGIVLAQYLSPEVTELDYSTQSHKPSPQWILKQITDLALDVKLSTRDALIWVTTLSLGNPVNKAKVKIYSRDRDVLFQGDTDALGLIKAPGLDDMFSTVRTKYSDQVGSDVLLPLTVFVQKGSDRAFMSTEWSTGESYFLYNYDYDDEDMEGDVDVGDDGATLTDLAKVKVVPVRSHLLTDRGLYKRGEEVQLKGYLREMADLKLKPFVKPVTVVIRKPARDEKPVEILVTPNERGNFTATFAVEKNADLGTYQVSIKPQDRLLKFTANEISGTSFSVQEFRTPDFKLAVTLNSQDQVAGDPLKTSFNAAYLFGAPIKKAPVSVAVDKRITSFFPKADEPWSYGRLYEHTEEQSDFWQISHEDHDLTTDAEGLGSLEVKTDKDLRDPVEYTIGGSVHDLSGQVQSGFAKTIVHPAAFYLGAKTQYFFYDSDDPIVVNFAALTTDGQYLADKEVTVDLMRVKWVSVKKETLHSRFETELTRQEEKVDSCQQKTVLNTASCTFHQKTSGYYFISLTAKDDKGRLAVTEVPLYVFGEGLAFWPSEDAHTVELVPDQENYKAGDTARLLLKSPYRSAQALIAIERDHVISYEFKELVGDTPVIEVPIRADFVPNVFVRVVLIRGTAQKDPSQENAAERVEQAVVKVGTAELVVEPTDKALAVTVKPDKEVYAPGETATLTFGVADLSTNEKAEVTVMVVDEGVLLAGGYTLENPLETFFARYEHRVLQADSRTHFVGMQDYKAKLETDASGGGKDERYRKNFIPLVYYNGEIITEQGQASVSFVVPDQLTNFKIMVIANAEIDHFGLAQNEFKTQKTVMIRPALPQFLRVGDRFDSRIVLHNTTSHEVKGQMTVTADRLDVVKGASGEVVVPASGTASYAIQLATNAATLTKEIDGLLAKDQDAKPAVNGVVRMAVKAEGLTDQVEITLPIYLDRQIETVSTSGIVKDQAIEVVKKSDQTDSDFGGLKIEQSANLMAQIKDRVKHLSFYPYDCLEQKMSVLYPFVLFPDRDELFTGLDKDKEYRYQQVRDFIKTLKREQTYDGEFSFWPGLRPSVALTMMVAEFLIEAREQGFEVEPVLTKIKTRIFDYFDEDKQRSLSYFDDNYRTQLKIHALYVLHRLGEPQPSHYQTFIDQKDSLPPISLARLVEMVHASEPESAFVQGWVDALKNQIRMKDNTAYIDSPVKKWSYFFGNTNRVMTAHVLQTLLKVNPSHPMTFPLLWYLIQDRNDFDYVSSLETRQVLLAMKAYLKAFPAAEETVTAKLLFNDQQKSSVQLSKQKPTDTLNVPITEVLDDLAITFKKETGDRLFYNMFYTYALKAYQSFGVEQGISYARTFYTVDGKKVEPSELKHGQTYKVVIGLFLADDGENYVIEEPVPAGLEPVNVALATANRSLYDKCEVKPNDLTCYLDHKQMGQKVIRLFGTYVPRGFWEFGYFVNATNRGVYLVPPGKALEMYSPSVFGTSAKQDVVVE